MRRMFVFRLCNTSSQVDESNFSNLRGCDSQVYSATRTISNCGPVATFLKSSFHSQQLPCTSPPEKTPGARLLGQLEDVEAVPVVELMPPLLVPGIVLQPQEGRVAGTWAAA